MSNNLETPISLPLYTTILISPNSPSETESPEKAKKLGVIFRPPRHHLPKIPQRRRLGLGAVKTHTHTKKYQNPPPLSSSSPSPSSSPPSDIGTEAFKHEGNQVDSDVFHTPIQRLQSLHQTSNIVEPTIDTFLQSSRAVIQSTRIRRIGPMQNPPTTTDSLLQAKNKVIAARDDGHDPKEYPGPPRIGKVGGGGGVGGGTVCIDVEQGGRAVMKAHSFLDDFLVRDAFATGRLCFDVGEILHRAPDEVFGQGTVLARAAVFAPDQPRRDVVEAHKLQRLLAFDEFGDFEV